MNTVLNRFNRFFELAPQALIPWRWLVLFVFISCTVVMLYGMMTRFTMDMALESWFQDDDPATLSLDRFREQFGSDDGVYIVYEAKDGDVFSEQSLKTLRDLQAELDDARVAMPDANADGATNLITRILRVDSLFNARYQIADGDTLISKKLIGREFPENAAERDRRRAIAQDQDNFELAFFSKNFQYGGIRLKTDFGVVPLDSSFEGAISNEEDLLLDDDIDFDLEDEDRLETDGNAIVQEIAYEPMQMVEYLNFMTELRTITSKPKYAHFTFYYTGNAPIMEFAMNNMKQASVMLFIMVLIVVGFLWALFHSISAVIWPISVIAGSAFWTIGTASWLGITMSNMVSLTFMLILAVGVADCVHVLSTYSLYRREQHGHREAISLAYRKTGLPIFLTTITTMAGMSALMISDIPQIALFGMTSAFGVFMAFLLTLFVLPVLLDLWHPYNDRKIEKIVTHKKTHWLHPLLNKIPEFVGRRAKAIVISYFAIFLLFLFGASQVKVDSNFAELTKEGSSLRVTNTIVDEQMMGGQNLELMMNFGSSDALKDPKVLRTIETLQRHVEKKYAQFVVKTFSLADFVKDTNKVMHEGLNEYKQIPEDARLASQLLFLFDNANPVDRRNLVSDDYSQSHVTVQLRNAGSYEYTQFFEDVQLDIGQLFTPLEKDYPNMQLNVTGSLPLMMKLIDHVSWTQIKSFSFALIIITLMMMLTLGSTQAGFFSMLPNLLPAFFTFGVMGLLGIPLDTDTLIIAPLIIGIAVDDTIHFIAHYRDAWFECGDIDEALHSTIKEVGQAVTYTTLILGVGFSTLAFSDYLGIAKTGVFGSLAIFVALTSDLLLLPALIKWLKPDFGRKRYLAKQAAGANA